MPYLQRGNVKLNFDEAGKGPAILFSHGFGATLHMFDPQVKALAAAYRVIRWDMRGHGETESPDIPAAYSQQRTVEDMNALLDDREVDTVVLAGMSLGGTMSLAYRARYPDRVRGLVLIDSGPGFQRDESRERWNEYAEGIAQALESGDTSVLGHSFETRDAKHRSLACLALAARGMMKQHGTHIIDSLKNIRVPTLIIVGGDDEAFLASADAMAAKIPKAEKHVIPDTGHAPNLDQPEIVNELLLNFLKNLDAKP
jgi:pimeloyl-ACP methyl ester carboxylesterase